jgi:serine phosphatase RsbU (regulator of sigma subunit)
MSEEHMYLIAGQAAADEARALAAARLSVGAREQQALRSELDTARRQLSQVQSAARARPASRLYPSEEQQIRSLGFEISALKAQNEALQLENKEKEAWLMNWRHISEAFKMLARKYGGELGVSDSARQRDFDLIALALAKESAEFKGTKLTQGATARLAGEKG